MKFDKMQTFFHKKIKFFTKESGFGVGWIIDKMWIIGVKIRKTAETLQKMSFPLDRNAEKEYNIIRRKK